MADKTLTSNVQVDGVWYGPDYPQNAPTSEVLDKITNPAAFEPAGGGVDLRTTAADFGVEEGSQPHVRSLDAASGATTALDLSRGPVDLSAAPTVAEAAEAKPAEQTEETTKATGRKGQRSAES